MAAFFSFRRMITPRLIQFLFIIGVVLSILSGIVLIAVGLVEMANDEGPASSLAGVLAGLALIVFGPLVIRVYCEFLILFFRINETLTDVDQKMDRVQAIVDRRGTEIARSVQASGYPNQG